MNALRRIMNKAHAVLITAKSVAGMLGAAITPLATGLAASLGADMPIVVLVGSVGVALTGFSVWEIPYEPFEIQE